MWNAVLVLPDVRYLQSALRDGEGPSWVLEGLIFL